MIPLEVLAAAERVECFRGDEEDVILRLSEASRAHDLDYALNITADCPLVDPWYADRIVEAYRETGADFIRAFDLPLGAFSYGLKPEAMAKVVEIKDDARTEVWGRYFTDTGLFRVHDLPIEDRHRWPSLRMTLDYPEDYEFFKALWSGLDVPPQDASLDQILDFLRSHPEIVEINRGCADRYRRRIQGQAGIRLKPRHEVHRAVVIGAGSIGQRHMRSLRKIGLREIAALRTYRGHAAALPVELGVTDLGSWEEVERFRPDVAIVSNPTRLHPETVHRVLPLVRGVFIEKPLSDTLEGIPELLSAVAESGCVTFMGYNLQFHPIAWRVAEALASERFGRPLSLQLSVGHWLPDWHPCEDFRTTYAARKDLGGGVALTLIHELQLVRSWVGEIERVVAVFPPNDLLPLEVDVQADLMMSHAGGCVSQLHMDYIQRPYHREGVISCERGHLRYDIAVRTLAARCDDCAEEEVLWSDPAGGWDESYVEMMATFIRYVREGRMRHEMDIGQGARGLAAVVAGMESARTGSWVKPRQFADSW